MATRNHTQTPVETESEALDATFPPTDDDPEEFTADVPVPANGTSRGFNASLDELNSVTFDSSTRDQDYKQLNPPTGDWLKEERWDFDKEKGVYIKEGDCKPGDINPKGRVFISVSGVPKSRVVDNIEYQPVMQIRVSPDKRLKDESDPKSMDMAYKLYLQSCEVYMAIHGKNLSKPSELVHFLTEDHFTIRSMNGDSGPLVTNIKQTRDNSKRNR
jgi:hypothetical protein